MDWQRYAWAVLLCNLVLFITLFAMLMLQHRLPLNPLQMPPFTWQLALNTAVSFVTNTNWQNSAGELTASYFTQTVGFTVHNYSSPSPKKNTARRRWSSRLLARALAHGPFPAT